MPSTFQTRTSMAQSARSKRPRGSEPVNSVFVVLLRLRAPPRSLVQPVPLNARLSSGRSRSQGQTPARPGSPADRGAQESCAIQGHRLHPGTVRADPRSAGRGGPLIALSPQTSLPISGLRAFRLQIGKRRPEQNREAWPSRKEGRAVSGAQAQGCHQICQEIRNPPPALALNQPLEGRFQTCRDPAQPPCWAGASLELTVSSRRASWTLCWVNGSSAGQSQARLQQRNGVSPAPYRLLKMCP